jgi:hypothetical protein
MNGSLKKTLIGGLVALLLALASWAGGAIVSQGNRLAAVEARQEVLERWLERVEAKLDAALAWQRRRP